MFETNQPATTPAYVQFGSPADPRYRGDNASRLQAWIEHSDTASVEQMCVALDMNHSRLVRLSRRVFGDTPKVLIRRARLLRMLAIMQVRPYREWRDFLDWRYVDQSHFIRDFRSFLGMAPSDYAALSTLAKQDLWAGLSCEQDFRKAA